jgi:hypothetical protein
MILKTLFRTAIFAGAVGIPVLYFTAPDMWAGAKKSVAAILAPSAAAPIEGVKKPAEPESAKPKPLSLEGPPVGELGEVFRFDITANWIMGRWTRVSTGLAQLQLQGYRVPLVTGTAENDLAGSLTYYFNPRQRVQKITFNGTTGDATRLVRFLMGRYGFKRRIVNDAGLFTYEAPAPPGEVRSILRIRPAGVVQSDQPYRRFHVDLVLERPAVSG